MPALRSTNWWLCLAAIFLAGVLLRGFGAGTQSFWYDEATTASLIKSQYRDLFRGTQKDNGNPPLYLLTARAWSTVFGSSDVALRSLSIVCGSLMIPLVGLLGRQLVGDRAALIAAGLLALSPIALELATEARTYALFHLITLASGLLFLQWLAKQRLLDLALYAIAIAVGCYSHYYAFLTPLGHGLTLLAIPETRQHVRRWLLAMFASAVLWLPWLPSFVNQLNTQDNLTRMAETWPTQFAATPLVFAFGRTLVWRESSVVSLGLASLAAILVLWVPAVMGFWKVRKNSLSAVFLMTAVVLPLLVPLILAISGKPLFTTRYASVALSPLLLLAGLGFVEMPRRARAVLASIAIALTTASVSGYFSNPLKDDWRSAAPVIVNEFEGGETLVFDTDIEVVSFHHYAAPRSESRWTAFGLVSGIGLKDELVGSRFVGATKTESIVTDRSAEILASPGVWLLLCVPNSTQAEYERLFKRHGYDAVKEYSFHRISIVHFQRQNRQ